MDKTPYPKRTVIEWLNNVDYAEDLTYIPDPFALEFVNFIKLVNGSSGEEHATPVAHLQMLDNVHGPDPKIINMCSRGLAKTTLMGEYLFLYIAVYGEIPDFGNVDLALYVSDSIENGVKNMRRNMEYRWENSEFLQAYIPTIKFTDIRWEFANIDGKTFIVKGYGAKALSLDTKLYTDSGFVTIKDVNIGDTLYSPTGKSAVVDNKSEVFNKPMYRISLTDGRSIDTSIDHINAVVLRKDKGKKVVPRVQLIDTNITTKDLLKLKLKTGTTRHAYIRNTCPVEFTTKNLPVDPYLVGLLLGDGFMPESKGVRLSGLREDIYNYMEHLSGHDPYIVDFEEVSGIEMARVSFRGLYKKLSLTGLRGSKDVNKAIPFEYQRGSIQQRRRLLAGMLDTDGSCSKDGRVTFSTISAELSSGIMELARSLGYTVTVSISKDRPGNRRDLYRVYIRGTDNPFILRRKHNLFKVAERFKPMVAIDSVTRIDDVPSQCISINSGDHLYLTMGYVGTHNTGVRGAKEMGKRPQLAVLDDLISDEDARSDTVIASIEATVNKAVNFALHPTFSKIIWSGTPFNARDPLYKAVESGAWKVNVYPICNEFPCTKEDFRGAWESRFPYSYVNDQYNFSLAQGKIADFNQELMLRIMSEEDRLISDGDILWYDRSKLLANKQRFNFYITTDFATSDKQSADFSVIAVWALNNKGFWFLVDGICKRQTMDKNVEDLFRLAQIYSPQSVGIEISGQQGGFIPWVQGQMLERNSYFNLATDTTGNTPGIRPNTNKMVRFNIVVPWFKSHLMFFPKELQNTPFIQEYISELSLVSVGGFKSKNDDCIDTISMLASLTVWRPSEETTMHKSKNDMWEIEEETLDDGALSSYVV